MTKTFAWTPATVAEFGSPDRALLLARSFVRRENGLYYRQYADSQGKPEKGAGWLFNPAKFCIGQNPCRKDLEALGLK